MTEQICFSADPEPDPRSFDYCNTLLTIRRSQLMPVPRGARFVSPLIKMVGTTDA